MREHASPCPMDTAGISQDEFRDVANGFVPEELGSAADVNAMMSSDMLRRWYEADKRGVGMSALLGWSSGARGASCMCCHGATHGGAHPQQRGHGLLGGELPRGAGVALQSCSHKFCVGLGEGLGSPGEGELLCRAASAALIPFGES